MKAFLLVSGIIILYCSEILRVYFIMPFPGSQQKDTIDIAYWLHNNIIWLRILGFILMAYPVYHLLRGRKGRKLVLLIVFLGLYAYIFYSVNFQLQADKMFYQPNYTAFAPASENKLPLHKLVIGISLNGESKAYPIQIIGYHHQVRDTVGNIPIMVTYCTVCRTGRIFSPAVDGQVENFRLVGMDHFNAMFEDQTTHSWWRQVNGMAIVGPLKGKALKELPSKQLSLAAWLRQNPHSLIMQPDTSFKKDYEDLEDFDNGTIKGGLEKRDSSSWKKKSWVIGIDRGGTAKAYDWNRLVEKRLIQDSLPNLPLVIALESDSTSYHVWNRSVQQGAALQFSLTDKSDTLTDRNTNSKWDMNGICIEGPLKGHQLAQVQAYQEFWHSWRQFHPDTKKNE